MRRQGILPLAATLALLLAADTGLTGEWRTLRELQGTELPVPSTSDDLVVRGTNPDHQVRRLWLRVDDARSDGYAQRVNRALDVPPGPFTIRIAAGSLRTPSGRALDLASLRWLLLFQPAADPPLIVATPVLEAVEPFATPAIALDFGPPGSAPFPGFTTVDPSDPRLAGKALRPRLRPSGDTLLDDGIEGIERLVVPLPDGRWQVTLWTEDQGEWEYLPHPLRRSLTVNGVRRTTTVDTTAGWIERVYLRGREPEAVIDGGPWDVFGRHRGGVVAFDVNVTDGKLVIEPGGDSPAATYVAALLVEPVGGKLAAEVEQRRARRFAETWRTAGDEPGPPVDRLVAWPLAPGTLLRPDSRPVPGELVATAAPGTAAEIELAALAPGHDVPATLAIEGPANTARFALAVEARFGHWRYRRTQTLLEPTSDHLRADLGALTLDAQVPRRLSMSILIPDDTPTGTYRGTVELATRAERVALPLRVEVPAVRLPPADRPVGTYLELPPWVAWFPDQRPRREAILRCDLDTLRSFGLTGIAPPLAVARDVDASAFEADAGSVAASGMLPPFLSYQTVPTLVARTGVDAAASTVAALAAVHPDILWSIADEPSNPGPEGSDPLTLAALLRERAPQIRLAGHLNAPDDRRFLPAFDVVLVNAGFGVDLADLEDVRAKGVAPWLYNMEEPRLAAGFYAWRTGAAGYLQWHGRMPTADPFDPTDGREGDFQLLPPAADLCARPADVDATLVAMAEGIVDLRWALWLEAQAGSSPAAAALLAELRAAVPTRWSEVRALGPAAAAGWRARIAALAPRG